VDLEKAFDRVPRKVIKWALRRKELPEQMVIAIGVQCIDSRTRLETKAGISKESDILVGIYQGSVLSPYLFIIVIGEVRRKIGKGVPWKSLLADHLIIINNCILLTLHIFVSLIEGAKRRIRTGNKSSV